MENSISSIDIEIESEINEAFRQSHELLKAYKAYILQNIKKENTRDLIENFSKILQSRFCCLKSDLMKKKKKK